MYNRETFEQFKFNLLGDLPKGSPCYQCADHPPINLHRAKEIAQPAQSTTKYDLEPFIKQIKLRASGHFGCSGRSGPIRLAQTGSFCKRFGKIRNVGDYTRGGGDYMGGSSQPPLSGKASISRFTVRPLQTSLHY